jgi:hypothetical protein
MFSSAAHRMFCKIDHILGNKASLNKYKKIKIISCISIDHNVIKLKLITRQTTERQTIQRRD